MSKTTLAKLRYFYVFFYRLLTELLSPFHGSRTQGFSFRPIIYNISYRWLISLATSRDQYIIIIVIATTDTSLLFLLLSSLIDWVLFFFTTINVANRCWLAERLLIRIYLFYLHVCSSCAHINNPYRKAFRIFPPSPDLSLSYPLLSLFPLYEKQICRRPIRPFRIVFGINSSISTRNISSLNG